MIVLGVTGPRHDTSAALFVDGVLVAAAEEERFTRLKHALKQPARESVRAVLELAGVRPDEVDRIAYPWSLATWKARRTRHLVRTLARDRGRAIHGWWKTPARHRRLKLRVQEALASVGIPVGTRPFIEVPHHDAHAASAFLLSGFDSCAILTVDGLGEQVATQAASFEDGHYTVLHREAMPHSLGCFYSTMTEFLGWSYNDGEYKLMGMAPYGDPSRIDLSDFAWLDAHGRFRVDPRAIWVGHRARVDGKPFGRRLVDRLGPPRQGDALSEPYIHIAAATQALFERAVLALVAGPLAAPLARTRRLAYAGGCALNVALNRLLVDLPQVERLYVPPAAHDAGTSIGAAAWVAWKGGDAIAPLARADLGPAYDMAAVHAALASAGLQGSEPADLVARVADLLAAGKIVGWFEGRMEMGPRALGHRSILAHPGRAGTAERVNRVVKQRETWRPFCPVLLDTAAPEILAHGHPAPFMTIAFRMAEPWRERLSEVVHVDGTARPQVLERNGHPRLYALLEAFQVRTGLPVLLNTSLNRRGEPIAASPAAALRLWEDGGLDALVLEDVLLVR